MKAKTATLIRDSGPYKAGQVVTTDPAAPLLAQAKAEEPIRVDPGRFATWQRLQFFEAPKRRKKGRGHG